MHKVSFMKTEQLTLYSYICRKKERRRERKQDFRRATIYTRITIRHTLDLQKHELMHDGSEMTTTGRDSTDTGGVKVIKRYQNNL